MKPRNRTICAIAVALAVPLVPFLVIGELPGERWLSAVGPDALQFGLAASGLLAADTLLPVPSSIVGSLLGARLGFVPGWLWGWAGMVAGNTLGYWGGRLLFLRAPADLPHAPTGLLLIASRPVPVLAEALAVASGAARLPFGAFLAACAAGNAVYAGALAAAGAALLPGGLAGPGLAVPLLIPAVGWILWRRFGGAPRGAHHPG